MGLRNWNTGQIWAEYRNVATGLLIPGTVTISLPLLLTNVADDATIPAGPMISQQALNIEDPDPEAADGHSFDLMLPGTDDDDIVQADWGWTVEVNLVNFGKLVYSKVPIPVGGATNLRTIIPSVRATVPQASLNLNMFARIENGLIVDANGNPITTGAEVGDVQTLIDALGGAA